MVDILKHTQYCMGAGYVNKKTYDEAVAQERTTNRVTRDMVENLMRATRDAQATAAQNNIPFSPTQNLVQQGVLFLATPLLALSNFLRAIPELPLPLPAFIQNGAQQLGARLNQAVGQLLSFFFGSRKAKNENEEEDLEKRDKEDFAQSDLFTRFVVEESNGSSLGGQ
jgi:hypothetical protein